MLMQFQGEVQADRKERQEKDFLLSFDELKSRAEAGNSSAQYLVGRAVGVATYGCVKNLAEGNKWIKLAAKNDENSPGSLCAQAYCYKFAIGEVTIKNKDKAKACYSKAVEQGYIPAFSELGMMLKDEAITTTTSTVNSQTVTHTHKDVEKLATAVKLFTTAAEAGYVFGLTQLAACYQKGHGVDKDLKEAFKLFRMASDKGSAYATTELAECYVTGHGVTIDYKEGLRLYHIASKQGYGEATRVIGTFYENTKYASGAGLALDKSEARKWYLAAEAQGYDVTKDLARTEPKSTCCVVS